jgi:hypothetical protein
MLYLVDGRLVGDGKQGGYPGTEIEQRHLALTAWLLEQGL